MLEVVFSESVQGTMRIAKNFNIEMFLKGSYPRGWGEIPSDILRRMYEGKPLEGSSDKVVYIGFYLDVGDIAGRIEKMIRDNKLSVVGEMDTSHPYGKILNKNKEAFREDQKCYC